MKKYVYIQPEYVREFRCDGQKCGAACCGGWHIPIDQATYEKYRSIKPKSRARDILKHIKYNSEFKCYLIEYDDARRCPFLTRDDWCSIQRRHGEGFLSQICRSYPRVTHCLGNFFERSLLPTCPVASEMILGSSEPMSFEQLELDEPEHFANGVPSIPHVPRGAAQQIFNVQYAAISILQSRNLPIDGRLIVLGFFLDRLEELIGAENFGEIETLAALYSSEEFLKVEAPKFAASIEFDARRYVTAMFKLIDELYRDQTKFGALNRRFLDAITEALEIKVDDAGSVSVSELTAHYLGLEGARRDFLARNSIKLEHYLVNEFFLGLYPWKLEGKISANYGVFVATYKMLELSALSAEVMWRRRGEVLPENYSLPAVMADLSSNMDHNRRYIKCVLSHLDGDLLTVMKSLL